MAHHRDLIFDVGLHKGEDTDFYLKKGFKVVAFEAGPDLVAHCRDHFQQPVADHRLRIIEGAVAPEAAGERIAFYKNLQKSEWGTIDQRWVERNEKVGTRSVKIEVGRVDLAEMFSTHGIPFYLKIDIEGADHLVLDELWRCADRPRYIPRGAEECACSQLAYDLTLLRRLAHGISK